jgi:polysaccharide pyruvyl transferase WcaK-like protein
MNILVLGFYNRGNLGDESYKLAFKKLLPKHALKFVCTDDINDKFAITEYGAIIVGGGDIINEYFNKEVKPILARFTGLKIAMSVGTSYQSFINRDVFQQYDYVFTRNFCDVSAIQECIPSLRANYTPDIAFALDAPKPQKIARLRPKCGVFLVQNLQNFAFICDAIYDLLLKVAEKYYIVFYLFNTSANAQENDTTISRNMRDRLNNIQCDINYKTLSAPQMLRKMSRLDFAICVRFHAHIFAMLANTPFMSISSSRKTRILMNYASLSKYQYKIELNTDAKPISANSADMIRVYSLIDATMVPKIAREVKRYKEILRYNKLGRILCEKDAVVPRIRAFMGEFSQDNTATLISKLTVGVPDSEYCYGIHEKIVNKTPIEESIEYMCKEPKLSVANILDYIEDFIEDIFERNVAIQLSVDINEYYSYKNAHRGGWYLAIEELYKHCAKNATYCDMYVDKTFHWNSDYYTYLGIIPYTAKWCGFIHHTKYGCNNIDELFAKPKFIASLDSCVALFTLSNSLTETIKEKLRKRRIPVYTFAHPIETPKIFFSCWSNNIVQIGSWMRNSFSLFALNTTANKQLLVTNDMMDMVKNITVLNYNKFIPSKCRFVPCRDNCEKTKLPRFANDALLWVKHNYAITNWAFDNNILYIESNKITNIKRKFDNSRISIIGKLDNEQYDALLSNSIVFLDLFDSAAVNTVIECLLRNTPILINKTAGVVEILGADYPMYFNSNQYQRRINREVEALLTTDNINKTIQYLSLQDKHKYKIDYFINNMKNVAIKLK